MLWEKFGVDIEPVRKKFDKMAKADLLSAGRKTGKTAKDTCLIDVGRAIKPVLLSLAELDKITHVIIENQISTIASRMKTVQGMIAQTFIMLPEERHIEFVSSTNKLKGFAIRERFREEEGDVSNKSKEKEKYKANKKDGIRICGVFLDANPRPRVERKAEFDKSKKKDDMSDCFLQGVWFLKSRKIIEYADDLRINSVVLS